VVPVPVAAGLAFDINGLAVDPFSYPACDPVAAKGQDPLKADLTTIFMVASISLRATLSK